MQKFLLGQKRDNSNDLGFSIILVILLITFYFIMTNAYSLVIVNGTSMEKTLSDGDVLFVSHFDDYDRGDVIVFQYDENMLIKRVIALEGDEIKCEHGVVSVKRNGEDEFKVVEEPYIIAGSKFIPPTVIKEGELFVLGDNRPISNDSSSFGPIKKDLVIGVVTEFSIKNKETLTKMFSWTFKINNKKVNYA